MFKLQIGLKPAYSLPRLLSFLIISIAALLATNAHAHKPSDSYLTLTAQANGSDIAVRWDIALRDLDYVLQLDRDNDGALTWGEIRSRGDDITQYATSNLQLSNKDKPCALTTTQPMQLDHHSDGTYAVLSLSAACGAAISEAVQVKYSLLFDVDPSHRGLLQWIPPNMSAKEGQESEAMSFVLGIETATQNLPLQAPSQWQSFKQYVVEGVWHIWIGFDHILFLLSLLLPAVLVFNRSDAVKHLQAAPSFWGAFKEVLKVVTAFTLAHSITLTLAALG
ncbi:MAG: HupE/UreJ family protein, partial [Polaromonas sp.]|nr:HupE/UreJ family protein [Polaromonas sp.]